MLGEKQGRRGMRFHIQVFGLPAGGLPADVIDRRDIVADTLNQAVAFAKLLVREQWPERAHAFRVYDDGGESAEWHQAPSGVDTSCQPSP